MMVKPPSCSGHLSRRTHHLSSRASLKGSPKAPSSRCLVILCEAAVHFFVITDTCTNRLLGLGF